MRFLFLSAETTKQRLHQYIARSQPNKQKRKAPKTKTEGMHHAKNGRSIPIKKRRKSSGEPQPISNSDSSSSSGSSSDADESRYSI